MYDYDGNLVETVKPQHSLAGILLNRSIIDKSLNNIEKKQDGYGYVQQRIWDKWELKWLKKSKIIVDKTENLQDLLTPRGSQRHRIIQLGNRKHRFKKQRHHHVPFVVKDGEILVGVEKIIPPPPPII